MKRNAINDPATEPTDFPSLYCGAFQLFGHRPLSACLMRKHSKRQALGLKVQKFHVSKAMKVGVEGDDAAACVIGEGCEVGIGPAMRRE